MHAPQIIYLVLIAINLLGAANQHGRPREPINFWSVLLTTAIIVPLLYWGGFFN